jgi:hypothetical protein
MANAADHIKYLAITLAGAVSLASYRAGATYEILDAIRQHVDRLKSELTRLGLYRLVHLTVAQASRYCTDCGRHAAAHVEGLGPITKSSLPPASICA